MTDAAARDAPPQPLAGLRVVEFTHMVMGPTCGMVLADLGAEMIKVEPIDGDRTRRLLGAGAGFFPMFNRNKKSIAIDLRSAAGAEVARRLAASADVVAENFKPGTMGKYGLDYAALAQVNPRVIYVSLQGLPARALRAPHRAGRGRADDGRARLHDRPARRPAARGHQHQRHHGRPVRRDRRARRTDPARHHGPRHGSAVRAVREQRVPRRPAHAAVRGDRQGAGADARARQPVGRLRRVHGEGRRADLPRRGQRFAVGDVLRRAGLRRPQGRPRARDEQSSRASARATLLKTIGERIAHRSAAELAALFERVGLPFAPIRRPEDLYDDPHLAATGGLADVRLPDGARAGQTVKTTLFPIHARRVAGWACGSTRRGWASTRASSCARSVTRRRRSTRCTHRTRSPDAIAIVFQHGGSHDPTPAPPIAPRSRSHHDRGRGARNMGSRPRAARRARGEIHSSGGDGVRCGHDHARGAAGAVQGARMRRSSSTTSPEPAASSAPRHS